MRRGGRRSRERSSRPWSLSRADGPGVTPVTPGPAGVTRAQAIAKVRVTLRVTLDGTRQVCRVRKRVTRRRPDLSVLTTAVLTLPQNLPGPKVPSGVKNGP